MSALHRCSGGGGAKNWDFSGVKDEEMETWLGDDRISRKPFQLMQVGDQIILECCMLIFQFCYNIPTVSSTNQIILVHVSQGNSGGIRATDEHWNRHLAAVSSTVAVDAY